MPFTSGITSYSCEVPGDLASWVGVLETNMEWDKVEELANFGQAAINDLQTAFDALLKHLQETDTQYPSCRGKVRKADRDTPDPTNR